MKRKSFWLLVISIITFISILLLFQFNYVESIDVYGKNIQNIFIHPGFKLPFLTITNIMSTVGIVVILGFTVYLLRQKDAKKDIILYISAILICLIVTNLIKIIIRRSRPLDMLLDVSGFSFPSSHASISMVVYGYLIILLKRYYHGKRKIMYTTLCILMILLTGLSRIYFNVHYITDVIAGFSLGLIILSISNLVIVSVE